MSTSEVRQYLPAWSDDGGRSSPSSYGGSDASAAAADTHVSLWYRTQSRPLPVCSSSGPLNRVLTPRKWASLSTKHSGGLARSSTARPPLLISPLMCCEFVGSSTVPPFTNARGAAALVKLGAVQEGTLRSCFPMPGAGCSITRYGRSSPMTGESRRTGRRGAREPRTCRPRAARTSYPLAPSACCRSHGHYGAWSRIRRISRGASLPAWHSSMGHSAFVSHRCERPFRCPRESSSRPRSCSVLRLRSVVAAIDGLAVSLWSRKRSGIQTLFGVGEPAISTVPRIVTVLRVGRRATAAPPGDAFRSAPAATARVHRWCTSV